MFATRRLLVASALFWAACTSPGLGDEALTDAAEAERFAIVSLAYDGAGAFDGELVARAYFVEQTGTTRSDVLTLLGLPLGAALDPELAIGHCVVETHDVFGTMGDAERAALVRLLDAGELTIQSAGDEQQLNSGYFPDITPEIGGLTYAVNVRDTAAFARRGAVTISADGSDEVGAFSVSVVPPEAVRILTIGGVSADAALPPVDPADDLSVTWTAAGRGADVAVVAFVRQGFDQVATVSCAARDDGAFTLPAAGLAMLPEFGEEQLDRVVVQRVSTVSFTAPDMPDGAAVAIAQDAVSLR